MEITENRYKKIRGFFLKKPFRIKILHFIYRFFPYVTAAAYVILLISLLFSGGTGDFLKALLIPAGAFLTVTVFRRGLNLPRPYEKLGIVPLIRRNKSGQSFPSRHCASAFVISAVVLSFNAFAGAFLLLISACIAASRVLAGVHFIRDAAAGALIGLLFGIIMFIV